MPDDSRYSFLHDFAVVKTIFKYINSIGLPCEGLRFRVQGLGVMFVRRRTAKELALRRFRV